MSEQVSGTHGPAEDDAIKRQDRSELEAHGEEWPEPESEDENDSDTTWASTGRFAGTPGWEDWEAIELRSDLARHLGRATFPATRARLLQTLTEHAADQRLLDLVSSLPAQARFASLGQLLPVLGLPIEARPAGERET